MQIILASAKIMRDFSPVPELIPGTPAFIDIAMRIASEMSRMTAGDIASAFRCSDAIGELNRRRFNVFGTDEAEVMPAIMAYYGQAYKHLRADTLSMDELEWADGHLWISSCLYGLLRPFDGISQYRMESGLRLKSTEGKKITDFWRPILTEMLIDSVKADDGVLVYLDTEEFRSLFDWKTVLSEIRVIEPGFHVMKGGRLTTPSVWAKTCRGAMARFLIAENASGRLEGNASSGVGTIEDALELIRRFSYEGFGFSPDAAQDELFPQFVRQQSELNLLRDGQIPSRRLRLDDLLEREQTEHPAGMA